MTDRTNPRYQRIFFRQINPQLFRNQLLQSNNFQARTDPHRLTPQGTPDLDYLGISVDIHVAWNDAKSSFDRYLRAGGATTGVVGISSREIESLDLTLRHVPYIGNPFHWHIVVPKDKNTKRIRDWLRAFASDRGWLYARAGVDTIVPPAKPAR